MAELAAAAEQVVIQGYVISEVTGQAIRVPDTSEEAEDGDSVVAPVISDPVALGTQKLAPLLRALVSHSHIQAVRRTTTPDSATGYYALLTTATNDPDVEAYGGRKITLPDGTPEGVAKVIQVPYNAPQVTVTTLMAAQTGLTVNTQVRAIWLVDAAEYVAPPAGPTAYYSAAQIDSMLAGLAAPQWTSIQGRPSFAAIATSGSASDLGTGTVPDARIGSAIARQSAVDAKVDKSLVDARGDMLVGSGDDTLMRVPVGSDGRVWTADSTVTAGASWQTPIAGGGGGSGSPDVPEYSRTQQAAALGTPTDLLAKLTSYNTGTATITQGLPLAQPGRYLGIRWDAGNAALVLAAASRTDSATVTSGSATVSDSSIQTGDAGRLVTGTGIPANTYVGTVTAGTSFLLSSSPTGQVNVTATAAGTSVVVSDVIGSGTATTRQLDTPSELLRMHCTITGQWRADGGYRPSERLTPVGPKTSAHIAQPGELVKVDTTSGPITITAPATGIGRAFAVKNLTGTNPVTVARAGSDTIGSQAATSIPVRYDDQVTHFAYDPTAPTSWLVTHNHLPPTAVAGAPQIFQGRATTSQILTTAGTYYPVALAAEDFDDLNGHSTATNTSRFVAPKAGVYRCSARVVYASGQATTAGTLVRIAAIAKNGTIVPGGMDQANYSGAVTPLPIIPIDITLAAGDYVEVITASGLASTTVFSDANFQSTLRVELIR